MIQYKRVHGQGARVRQSNGHELWEVERGEHHHVPAKGLPAAVQGWEEDAGGKDSTEERRSDWHLAVAVNIVFLINSSGKKLLSSTQISGLKSFFWVLWYLSIDVLQRGRRQGRISSVTFSLAL